MPEYRTMKQKPLVIYTYWLAQRPGEPHVGYGTRQAINSQGITGLALSGTIFGLFVSFDFVLPVLSVFLAWWTLSPLLHGSSANDAGWYELDDRGHVVSYLGRKPPQHIRGRAGVRRTMFLKQVQFAH